MKKITGLLLIIVTSIAIMSGCESFSGTTVSRIMKSGEWIYYINIKEDTLYKMKPDFSEKTKFESGVATDYSVIQEDNIYYIDGEGISKVQTDGRGQAKVLDLEAENMFGFYVSGDWIYYPLKSGEVYRVKTDGTEKNKIAKIGSFNGSMTVSGDWIYYEDGNNLSRMKTDGTGAERVSERVWIYEIKDGLIYYGEESEKGEIVGAYRMKLDGSEKSKLVDGNFVAIEGDRMYYGKKDGLFRAKLDGSAEEKLNDEDMFNICEIDDKYIYYIAYSGAAYRINLDGSGKVRIE